ncbi:lysophospholipase [Streptomyces sp. NBC_01239]|uniref:alpha/beta hydrolase n=1 Tax=Streptomyces sp. NBC_01239 TaxID=2903792 RepID=UPI00224F799A|nr:alpha/beta fold hydrolase [Streptomyces sp. NBC_01239]MCX4815985.1 lysophospholipase [Streptomyces sp. NBC_01239]
MNSRTPDVVSRVVDVDGIPMSALVCEVPDPRAVIVALHGGAVTSGYYDYPGRPRLSLLRTAAALGFTVVAIDRPGYGSSAPHGETMASPARRVDLAYGAVDRLLASRSRGAGLFLWAHSIGCALGVYMAGDERRNDLLGLEIAGTGRHHAAGAVEILDFRQRDPDVPRRSGPGLRTLLWEPARLYPDEVIGAPRIQSAGPPYEATVARRWPLEFAEVAARVRIPVHYTLGDHERVWSSGPEAMADIAGLFTRSSRVVTDEQTDSGHNLSIGHTATGYHLRILSFVEECVLAAENGGYDNDRIDRLPRRVG